MRKATPWVMLAALFLPPRILAQTPTPSPAATISPTPLGFVCQVQLDYSTFLGGAGDDYGCGVAIDSTGCVFTAGKSSSTDFPMDGPYQPTYGGAIDAGVAKLSSPGSALIFSTYFGGYGADGANSLAIDGGLNAYLVGYTTSADFPTLSAYQASFSGNTDIMVAKFASSGSALLFSTYLGGSGQDNGTAIFANAQGFAYLSGYAASGDFPTANSFQPSLGGGRDAVICCLSSSGTSVIFSTYLGGSSNDCANDISLDSTENLYIVGTTHSSNFPVQYAYDSTGPSQDLRAYADAFVAKFDPAGSYLCYSTYLGTGGINEGNGVAVGSDGSAFVAGDTNNSSFPVINAYQPTKAGSNFDGFVTRLDSSGSSLVFSTYLGGDRWGDQCLGIAVHSDGRVLVTGFTTCSNFPTVSPWQASLEGGVDAFVTAFDSMGSSLSFSTYLGGAGEERGQSICAGSDGSLVLAGYTYSSDFPVARSYQNTLAGGADAFLSRLFLDCHQTTPTPVGYKTATPTRPPPSRTPLPSCTPSPTRATPCTPSATPTPSVTCTPQGYQTPLTIFVPDDYSTIQAAIDAASQGGTIVVRDGLYTGTGNKNLQFFGKAATLRSENGPKCTIIDCENNGRGFAFQSGEGRSTTVIGFTIQNGNPVSRGGGILIDNASPLIADCIITANKVVGGEGGGISIGSGSPLISGCTISNNSAQGFDWDGPEGSTAGSGYGGGVCGGSSSAVIENCRISGNTAEGGDFIRYAEGNGGDGFGGGICGSPSVLNCEITGNKAILGISYAYHPINNYGIADGAGAYGSAVIINCTVANNRVVDFFGGHVAGVRGGTIADSIVWGNLDGDQVATGGTVSYSDIEGGEYGFIGEHIISEDPRFAQQTSDYRLLPQSPCIDAGDNSASPGGVDLDRNPRIIDGGSGMPTVDMGAHEYQPPSAIREGFDGFQTGTRPVGWTFENCNDDSDTFTSPWFYGAAPPSLALDGTGDRVVSRPFACSRSEKLYFWIRGSATGGGSSLLVEEFYASAWNGITEIRDFSAIGTVAGAFTLNTDSSQVRFAVSNSLGALAFDDVCITQPTASPTPVGYKTPTPSPSPIPTPSATPLLTPTPEPSATPTPGPSPSPSIACDFRLSGRVVNAVLAESIPGAKVRLAFPDGQSQLTATDENGAYGFTVSGDHPAGTVSVEARRRGFDPGHRWNEIWWDCQTAIENFDLQLTPRYDSAGIAGGDYDGDGRSDIALFRPESVLWAVRNVTRIYFGSENDELAPGDYDGDGTTEAAIFRPQSALYAVRNLTRITVGQFLDVPVPNDYAGDGTCRMAIFRPWSGMWAVADFSRWYWGANSPRAVPGDYDGDGTTDAGCFAIERGQWRLRLQTDLHWGVNFSFGTSGDCLTPGDYDGNGTAEAAVFRQSSALWSVRNLTRFYLGSSDDRPAPADYSGVGTDEAGIFRDATGMWSVRNLTRVYFGSTGDVPVTR